MASVDAPKIPQAVEAVDRRGEELEDRDQWGADVAMKSV